MFVLVLVLMLVAVAAWWQLLSLVYETLLPRFERWLWRRLGGTGEPPP